VANFKQRLRKDGSAYFNVMFRLNGRKCSVSFGSTERARKFKQLIELVGQPRQWGSTASNRPRSIAAPHHPP
jgi:hypothetical protein